MPGGNDVVLPVNQKNPPTLIFRIPKTAGAPVAVVRLFRLSHPELRGEKAGRCFPEREGLVFNHDQCLPGNLKTEHGKFIFPEKVTVHLSSHYQFAPGLDRSVGFDSCAFCPDVDAGGIGKKAYCGC